MAAPINVFTQRYVRHFMQPGGASPVNPLFLAGVGMGYAAVTGVTRVVNGGIENIPVRDPNSDDFISVGSTDSTPSFSAATLMLQELIGGIPLPDTLGQCPGTDYDVVGSECSNVSDPLTGYKGGYVRVYPNWVINGSIDLGDRPALTDSNPLTQSIPMSIRSPMFVHSSIYVGKNAPTVAGDIADKLTRDVVYGNKQVCGNCGSPDDGTKFKYWASQAGVTSPGTKPMIFYKIGAAAPVGVTVTTGSIAEDLVAIAIVGDKLVVVTATAGGAGIGGYHYATIGTNGVPGSWTEVLTGFQSNKEPTDILVISPQEIYFSANGGYIYKSTDITAGVSVINAGATTTANLLRIKGNRQAIVAVGATQTIIKSNNSGLTWAATTSTPSSGSTSYQAAAVIGSSIIWVGTANGRLFYTVDGGETWAETAFNGSSAGSVPDVVFVNENEGYFLHNTATPTGRIFRTYTGGLSWSNTTPAIEGLAAYTGLRRIAVPTVGNMTLRANNIAVAGDETTTQGLLLTGSPQVL